MPSTIQNGLGLDKTGRSAMKTWRAELPCVLSYSICTKSRIIQLHSFRTSQICTETAGAHQDEVNYVEWFSGTTHRVYGRKTPRNLKQVCYVLTHNYFMFDYLMSLYRQKGFFFKKRRYKGGGCYVKNE